MRPATGDSRGAHVPRVDLYGPNRGQRRRTGTGRRNVGPAAETRDGDLTGRHRLRAEPLPTAPPAVRSPRHTRRGPSLSGLPGHVVTSAVMLSAGTIVTGSVLLAVEGSDWTAPVDGPPRTAPTTEALADRPGTSTTDPAPRLDIGLGFVPEPAADWLDRPGSVFAMPGQIPAPAEIDDRAGIDQLVGLIDVPIPDATAPIGSEPSPLPAVLDGGGGDRLQVPPPIAAEIVGPVPSSAAPLLPSPASRIQEDKRSTDRIKSRVPATDGVGELQVADADIVPPPVVAALRAVDPGPLVVDGSTAGTDKAPATSLASRSLEPRRDTIAVPVPVAPVAVAPDARSPAEERARPATVDRAGRIGGRPGEPEADGGVSRSGAGDRRSDHG